MLYISYKIGLFVQNINHMYYKEIDVKFRDPNTLAMALYPFLLVSKDLPFRQYNRVV